MNEINLGDRVSWKWNGALGSPGQRQFGTIIDFGRVRPKNFKAYRVEGDDGTRRIIPAKYITKEVG